MKRKWRKNEAVVFNVVKSEVDRCQRRDGDRQRQRQREKERGAIVQHSTALVREAHVKLFSFDLH